MMNALLAARSLIVACAGFLLGLLIAAAAVPVAARAATPPPTQTAAAAPDAGRTLSIVVYGDDPCPPSANGEIVVCARQPESERYRIPKRFRDKKHDSAPGTAWGSKVRSTEDASRAAAGLPDTCSAVGSGGQSGCYSHFLSQSYAERRQQKQEDQDTTTPDVPQ